MADETYTYQVELTTNTMWVGAETRDVTPLEAYGISDQEWDGYPKEQQDDLLEGWAEENFWNQGYEYNGRVERG